MVFVRSYVTEMTNAKPTLFVDKKRIDIHSEYLQSVNSTI